MTICHVALFETTDNIMFITPPFQNHTNKMFVANAASPGSVSTYYDRWGVDLRAVSHELGHNLGLSHAGKGTDPYGDHTSYMSLTGGPETSDAPLRCVRSSCFEN